MFVAAGLCLFAGGCAEEKPPVGGVKTVSPPITTNPGAVTPPVKLTPPPAAGSTTGGGTETPATPKDGQ